MTCLRYKAYKKKKIILNQTSDSDSYTLIIMAYCRRLETEFDIESLDSSF